MNHLKPSTMLSFFFPFSGGNRERYKASEYLLYGGAGFLIIFLIVLYVFEFSHFNRTLNARRLVVGSLLVGVILGVILGRRFQDSGEDMTEKIQIYVFFIFICGLFMPLFGSLANRLLSFSAATPVPVEFVEEKPFYSSLYGMLRGERARTTGYYLFFYKDQRLHRIENKQPMFPNAQQGDTVAVPVKRGLFGVEFVGQ